MTLMTLLPALWLGVSDARAGDQTPPCLTEDVILREARVAFPTRYDSLMRMKSADPVRYERLLHNTSHVLEEPKMIALQTRVDQAQDRFDQLVASLAKASGAQKDDLETQLIDAAEELVSAQIAVKRARLNNAREAVRSLEEEVRQQEAGRDASVDELLDRAFR